MATIATAIIEECKSKTGHLLGIGRECDEKGVFSPKIQSLFSPKQVYKLVESVSGIDKFSSEEEAEIFFRLGSYCSSTRNYFLVSVAMVAATILKFGSAAQKLRCKELILAGDFIGSLAITEPLAGSNIDEIKTKYEIVNETVQLTGHKRWITLGAVSNMFLIAAVGKEGRLLFVVEPRCSSFTRQPMKGLASNRGSAIANLEFEHLQLKVEDTLGGDFDSSQKALDFALMNGRAIASISALAMANSAVREAIEYAKSREQFGKKIWHHQLIQKIIGDSWLDINAGHHLCLNAFSAKHDDDASAMEHCINAKLFATKVVQNVTAGAMQIIGGNSLTKDFNIERYHREASAFGFIEGSNEILTQLVAQKALIGLPKMWR